MGQYFELVTTQFPIEFTLVTPLPVAFGIYMLTKNPYSMEDTSHGSARFANSTDVKNMGIIMPNKGHKDGKGYIITLGKFNGEWLAMKETLTVLAAAPPGTGKTTAICIPTILKCDYDPSTGAPISMVINDVKPELHHMTSGHVAKRADVWQISFGDEDKPAEGKFIPRWNFLSPSSVPAFGSARDMYVDNMAAVIQPDNPQSSDDFWIKAARFATTGLLHWIISKTERANLHNDIANWFYNNPDKEIDEYTKKEWLQQMTYVGYTGPLKDPVESGTLTLDMLLENPIGTFDGIPERWWVNETRPEASMPMLLDTLTENKLRLQKEAEEAQKQAEESGDPEAMVAQAMMGGKKEPESQAFEIMVSEADKFGYHRRAVMEIQELAGLAAETRTSIMKNFDTGVNIFKNTAVAQRTCFSDFNFRDFRGRWCSKEKKFKAMVVYLSVKVQDAIAMATVTGLFVQSLSMYLISFKPNKLKSITPFFLIKDEVDLARAAKQDTLPIANIHPKARDVLKKELDQAKQEGRDYLNLVTLERKMENLREGVLCDDEGIPIGPAHMLFLLDEFPRLPKMDTLMVTPEVGRGQKMSMLLICQDLGQVEEKFSQSGVERFMTNSAGKVVLPLTNDKTAQRFAALAGKMTVDSTSMSGKEGTMKLFEQRGYSKSRTGRELIFPTELMTMRDSFGADKHIVFLQDYAGRPIVCDTPFFFKDDTMKYQVHPEEIWGNSKDENGRYKFGDENRATAPMPPFALAKRKMETGNGQLLTDAEIESLPVWEQEWARHVRKNPKAAVAGANAEPEVIYPLMDRDQDPDAPIFLIYHPKDREKLLTIGAREMPSGDLYILNKDDRRKFMAFLPLRYRDGFPGIHIDILPFSAHYADLANLLIPDQWTHLRKLAHQPFNNHCELCGRQGGTILEESRRNMVECHEQYAFSSPEDTKAVMRLERLMSLCPDCHLMFHLPYAAARQVNQQVVDHIGWINRWDVDKAREEASRAWQVWQSRSNHSWILNFGVLEQVLGTIQAPQTVTSGEHPLPKIEGIRAMVSQAAQ
jgi:type IV secretory pathway TraG/TraD family ATPase VirD4